MDMFEILSKAYQMGASDIHIVIGKPPLMRLKGQIVPVDINIPEITSEVSKTLIYSILYAEQRQKFEENLELDCSFELKNVARFRVNVFMQKNGVEAVLRIIPSIIPLPSEIGLTDAVVDFINLPRGLVLVTGPTGSGKSTTLACLINLIVNSKPYNIITIEDPIEFSFTSNVAVVRQREVGTSTKSFANALRSALREDPDVILVGEMRDLETISLAITAAETGHLVFATLHTNDAPSTVDRIIDVFPPHQQQQIRIMLSNSLKGVVCQTLLPRKDGVGRVAAREVMVVTPAIANLIREGKTHMIYNAIETGAKFGMISMDRALLELVENGVVSVADAMAKANNPELFRIRA